MLSKTTELAIQVLIHLALQEKTEPLSPRQIAQTLEASPTYLAKTSNMLVKANILKAYRGALGGVILSRPPESITLLEIVEACQGQVVGNYCRETSKPHRACAFHQAMHELHQAVVGTLTGWTLRDLAAQPGPGRGIAIQDCRMGNICPKAIMR